MNKDKIKWKKIKRDQCNSRVRKENKKRNKEESIKSKTLKGFVKTEQEKPERTAQQPIRTKINKSEPSRR